MGLFSRKRTNTSTGRGWIGPDTTPDPNCPHLHYSAVRCADDPNEWNVQCKDCDGMWNQPAR